MYTHTVACLRKSEDKHQSQFWLSTMCALGSKLGLSGLVAGVLNCWAIFVALIMLLGASFIPCAGLPCCRTSGHPCINHLLFLSLSMPLLSIVTDYLRLFLKAHIPMVVFLLGSHLYFSSIMMGCCVFLNPKSLFPFGSHCFAICMSYFFFFFFKNGHQKIPDRSSLRKEGLIRVHGSEDTVRHDQRQLEHLPAWNVDQEVGSQGRKGRAH